MNPNILSSSNDNDTSNIYQDHPLKTDSKPNEKDVRGEEILETQKSSGRK